MNRRIAQDESNTVATIGKTLILAVLTGIGIAVGFQIVRKLGVK